MLDGPGPPVYIGALFAGKCVGAVVPAGEAMKKSTKAKGATTARSAKGTAKASRPKKSASAAKLVKATKAPKAASRTTAKASGIVKRPIAATAKKADSRAKSASGKPSRPSPKAGSEAPVVVPKKKGRGAKKPAPSRAALVAGRRKTHARYREMLLEKQREQIDAYSAAKEDTEISLDNGTEDYIDYAVNSYARDFLLSLTELDRKQLLQIEDALRRIDRGEYGRCQQCGETINPKRLDVQPWARHCVRCQELEEQGLLPQYPASAVSEDYDEDEEVETQAEPDAEEEIDEDATASEGVDEESLVGDGLPVDAEDSEE